MLAQFLDRLKTHVADAQAETELEQAFMGCVSRDATGGMRALLRVVAGALADEALADILAGPASPSTLDGSTPHTPMGSARRGVHELPSVLDSEAHTADAEQDSRPALGAVGQWLQAHEEDYVEASSAQLDPAYLTFGSVVQLRSLAAPGAHLCASLDDAAPPAALLASLTSSLPGRPDSAAADSMSVSGLGTLSVTSSTASLYASPGMQVSASNVAATGCGTGRHLECFVLENAAEPQDETAIAAGDVVVLRSAVCDKYLGVAERILAAARRGGLSDSAPALHSGSSGLVLAHELPGEAEHWRVHTPASYAAMSRGQAHSAVPQLVRAAEPMVLALARYPDVCMTMLQNGQASVRQLEPHVASALVASKPQVYEHSTASALTAATQAAVLGAIARDPGYTGELFQLAQMPAASLWCCVPRGAAFAPEWLLSRPFTVARTAVVRTDAGQVPLVQLGAAAAEAALVDDLLSALLGGAGRYITARSVPPQAGLLTCTDDHVQFQLGEAATAKASGPLVPLLHLASKLLPLATTAARCRGYAARRAASESGAVAQALAASVRRIMGQFDVLVAQLEVLARGGSIAGQPAGAMSLQRLHHALAPSADALVVLEEVLFAAPNAVGGELLQVLYKTYKSCGEGPVQLLLLQLLTDASQLWLDYLRAWVYRGELPKSTVAAAAGFMVKQTADTEPGFAGADPSTPTAWDRRYELQHEHVPGFLAPHTELILCTGKYVAALRSALGPSAEAAGLTVCPSAGPFVFSADAPAYSKALETAHAWASATLLRAVLMSGKLLSRMRLIKALFLGAAGDSLTFFMDMAMGELQLMVQPAAGLGLTAASRAAAGGVATAAVSQVRLQTLLDVAVRAASTSGLPFHEGVQATLQPLTVLQQLEWAGLPSGELHLGRLREAQSGEVTADDVRDVGPPTSSSANEQLQGHNSLCLSLRVPWPASLVLHAGAMSKYQLLFRHLFFVRHVQRCLAASWQAQQSCKHLALRSVLIRSCALRQRMLHFMHNLMHYMTSEVLEPRWHEMQAQLRQCRSIDDVRHAHDWFLDRAMSDCLVTHYSVLKVLNKLIRLCLLFATQLVKAIESSELTDEEVDQRAGISRQQLEALARIRRMREQRQQEGFVHGRGAKRSARGKDAAPDAAARAESGEHAVLSDIELRRRRLQARSAAMGHTMAQPAWQDMIVRSQKVFNSLLREFLQGLSSLADKQLKSHLKHLRMRLDFNGYYSQLGALQV